MIGLVAPIGTDPDPVCRALSVTFERLGYTSRQVRLTDYLSEVLVRLDLLLRRLACFSGCSARSKWQSLASAVASSLARCRSMSALVFKFEM